MPMPLFRPAILDDLPSLTDIYNHYVVNTAMTIGNIRAVSRLA